MSDTEQKTSPGGGDPARPGAPAPDAAGTPLAAAETAPAVSEAAAGPAGGEGGARPEEGAPPESPAPPEDAPSPEPETEAAPGEPAPKAAKTPAPKVPADIKRLVEALLFSCDTPLSFAKIRDVVPRVSAKAVEEAALQLREEYARGGHAFELVEIAEGYQILTKPEYEEWITRLKKAKGPTKLSGAALETLAIIAYKQPIRRVDIEAIRGVQSGELVRALMERGLIKITGRADQPGSPILYGTTKDFLDVVGLKSLEELPKPEEVK